MKEVPIWEKTTLTLTEAAAYSGIGIARPLFPLFVPIYQSCNFRQQDIVVNLKNSFIILINSLLFLRLISQVNPCYLGPVVT